MIFASFALVFFAASAADLPKVVSLEPKHKSADLDAKAVTKLVIEFDKPMSEGGWSFCGGEEDVPEFLDKPQWETPKKLVIRVKLKPDHKYQFSLNCPAATNFRSADGKPINPTPWSFTTLPEKLPDPAKQKAENRKAFEELKKTLANSYSYYDLRVKSWDDLYKKNEAAILGAKTKSGWAGAVSAMLAATEDIHVHLKLGEQFFPGGTRAVDSLFRPNLLSQYMATQKLGEDGFWGRTDEGIGYLMIPNWTDEKLVEAIEKKVPALRECKALVIDARPNSGGGEDLAQRVAAWFLEGEKVYAKNRYRTGPGKNGFGPVYDRTLKGKSQEERIEMPIAVLQSRYVMSSNESFVMMMKQAKDCTTIGQTTYGSSGNPKPHKLSNGVTIVLPSWQDLRLDGSCLEGEGLKPDIEVATYEKDFETKDPILEAALEMLRKKLKPQ